MKKPKKIRLDSSDLEIAHALKKNARLSYKKLGSLVNMTAPSAYERIKPLKCCKKVV